MPLVSATKLWKTFLFLVSQISQRMRRSIKGRTEEGRAAGKVVVKNSAIRVNCGRIPVARHTLRAAGQVKKRCSWSSTALLHLGQVSELSMCFLRRFFLVFRRSK